MHYFHGYLYWSSYTDYVEKIRITGISYIVRCIRSIKSPIDTWSPSVAPHSARVGPWCMISRCLITSHSRILGMCSHVHSFRGHHIIMVVGVFLSLSQDATGLLTCCLLYCVPSKHSFKTTCSTLLESNRNLDSIHLYIVLHFLSTWPCWNISHMIAGKCFIAFQV